MGCFWGPDALFGSLSGVLRTRVGYAGGTSAAPTYWTIGDHTETLQLDFDPSRISYLKLLELFFSGHNTTREPWKQQYRSIIFYNNPEQQQLALQAMQKHEAQRGQPVQTLLLPYTIFYLAEDRHQKYKLQRHPQLWQAFKAQHPHMQGLIDATAAARANGYLYGYGSKELLQEELGSLKLPPQVQELLLKQTVSQWQLRCAG